MNRGTLLPLIYDNIYTIIQTIFTYKRNSVHAQNVHVIQKLKKKKKKKTEKKKRKKWIIITFLIISKISSKLNIEK